MKRLIKAYLDTEAQIKKMLPSGSGFDSDWTIEKDGDHIKASSEFHAMDINGMYMGYIPFTVVINKDGSLGYADFYINELAKSPLGKDIAENVYADSDEPMPKLTNEDIKDMVKEECSWIDEDLYSTYETVDKQQMADLIAQYIAE